MKQPGYIHISTSPTPVNLIAETFLSKYEIQIFLKCECSKYYTKPIEFNIPT